MNIDDIIANINPIKKLGILMPMWIIQNINDWDREYIVWFIPFVIKCNISLVCSVKFGKNWYVMEIVNSLIFDINGRI